jgi:DNA recombination protein RmuC
VRTHVDAIAAKYVRPDEGTSDFAFMYIPVEAVYYELACGPAGSILQYAHERRVFPMSPSTFTAYLQVIAFGLRGMQIEQRAHEVMAYVADLSRDFDRFVEDFELVGKHLGNAQTKFASADKRLDKFAGKLERASEEADVDEIEADVDDPPYAIEAA